MGKEIREDISILIKFIKKHGLFYLNKVLRPIQKFFLKKKIQKQTLVETILEFEGAQQLGGEFLGKQLVDKYVVRSYRLRRTTTDGSPSYYFIGYIVRENNDYQVVAVEDWGSYLPAVQSAIKSNQKAVIGIRRREGTYKNVKSRSRNGRKIL